MDSYTIVISKIRVEMIKDILLTLLDSNINIIITDDNVLIQQWLLFRDYRPQIIKDIELIEKYDSSKIWIINMKN